MTPDQFWRCHPMELYWWFDAQKATRVYQGKKFSISGGEVDGILADLKARGIETKWRKRAV